jgi:hypothetical protein
MIILKITCKITKILPYAIYNTLVYMIIANIFLKTVIFVKEYLKNSDIKSIR